MSVTSAKTPKNAPKWVSIFFPGLTPSNPLLWLKGRSEKSGKIKGGEFVVLGLKCDADKKSNNQRCALPCTCKSCFVLNAWCIKLLVSNGRLINIYFQWKKCCKLCVCYFYWQWEKYSGPCNVVQDTWALMHMSGACINTLSAASVGVPWGV